MTGSKDVFTTFLSRDPEIPRGSKSLSWYEKKNKLPFQKLPLSMIQVQVQKQKYTFKSYKYSFTRTSG